MTTAEWLKINTSFCSRCTIGLLFQFLPSFCSLCPSLFCYCSPINKEATSYIICPRGAQRRSAPHVEAKRSCFLLNVQKWITILSRCLQDRSHDLRPFRDSSTCRETWCTGQRRRRIYSSMSLSFFTFSLTCGEVLIYLPTLSFFLSSSHSITSSLLHTHTRTHILFPITDVPFHQMKTKAKL